MLVLLMFTGFALQAKAGLDSYEIYLNDKLLLKQFVNEPVSLASLQLNNSNQNDKIIIYYSQCNAPGKVGKGRSISIKDDNGQVVKEWKFEDASDSKAAMVIPVKDLLQLERSNAGQSLSLFYNAQGTTEARKLTSVQISAKAATYMQAKKPE
jgi:hypothetical protein